MPAVPRIAGDWAMAFGRAAVVFTVARLGGARHHRPQRPDLEASPGTPSLIETVGFLTAVSLLAASASAYLFGRLGFYYRAQTTSPDAAGDARRVLRRPPPRLTALIPSYQEEPGVILMTLLSTALQEYPDLRVVLLVDDPPGRDTTSRADLLDAAMALPGEVERLLSEPRLALRPGPDRFRGRRRLDRTPRLRPGDPAGRRIRVGRRLDPLARARTTRSPTTTSASSPTTSSASSPPTSG